MAHENHYAKCGGCGWIGKESELPSDPNHECGKDQCPECKEEDVITCCFHSYEDAKIGHHKDDLEHCECPDCQKKRE